MPELPEVETLRRGLRKYVVGHTIESVEVRKPKIFQGDKKHVEGAKVKEVQRFGKGLVIDLSNNYSLAIHIKLTGQLIYRNKELGITNKVGWVEVPNQFTHVVFVLDAKKSSTSSPHPNLPPKTEGDQGSYLFYNDIRQFGWIKVVPTSEVGDLPFFKELGPEFSISPSTSSGKNNITIEQFSNILAKSKTAIKPLIMNQKRMAGVGNIYANDALYLAKIDPRRPANSLNSQEVKDLYKAILTVLKKGLEEGGASELTFVNVLGESGNYQNHSLVYGREGQKCKRDGETIKKFMFAGRGTYVCPACQG